MGKKSGVLRVVYAPVNAAWCVLVYGREFLDLDGQRFFPKKKDLVSVLRSRGLSVRKDGSVGTIKSAPRGNHKNPIVLGDTWTVTPNPRRRKTARKVVGHSRNPLHLPRKGSHARKRRNPEDALIWKNKDWTLAWWDAGAKWRGFILEGPVKVQKIMVYPDLSVAYEWPEYVQGFPPKGRAALGKAIRDNAEEFRR